jgi:hypothetical protein
MAHRCPGSARRHVRKWRKLTLRRNLFSQPRVGEMRSSLLHVAFADEFTCGNWLGAFRPTDDTIKIFE